MDSRVIERPDYAQGYILIVDDSRQRGEHLKATLSEAGYHNIRVNADAEQLVPLCRRERFELILLDINTLHCENHRLVDRLIEALGSDTPPILVVAEACNSDQRVRAIEAGARDYITRPFDRLELTYRIRNLIDAERFYRLEQQQKSQLESVVEARTRELRDSRLEIIQRLGLAAEYKDKETGQHIVRMSHYCTSLAHAIGLDAPACELILNASPMHDIGKIGIEDSILKKHGRLDPDEYEVMKSHTTLGALLLSGNESKLFTTAREIALTHHERWDGSGYPNAIAGDEIPLVGRIAAIADVFDALTTPRPYKSPWQIDTAFNHIGEHAGSQFDPQLSEAFLDIRDEIEQVHDTHLDQLITVSNQSALHPLH